MLREKMLPFTKCYKSLKRGSLFITALIICAALVIQHDNVQAAMCSDTSGGASSIDVGYYHSVAIKEDGTAVAVGDDWNASVVNKSGWTQLKAVATGHSFTIGLKEDGTVVGVGSNQFGQLDVSGWTGIKAIAAGENHSVGLKEDGTVVAVGLDWRGTLNVSEWTGIKAIAAGNNITVGLKEEGTVVAVGRGATPQTWTGIKAISMRWHIMIGLKEDGTVVAVGGSYEYGQFNVSDWTNIKAVDAGFFHSVGLKEDGTVVAVGFNKYGQLNVSDWVGITAISTGPYNTVGLKKDGTAVAVGFNKHGQSNVSGWTDIRQPCDGLPSTPADIAAIVKEMLDDGRISGPGNSANALAGELIQMLISAQDDLDTLPEPQKYFEAIDLLNDFIEKVSDQTCNPDQGNGQCKGKKITTEAGAELIGYAESLIEKYNGML